MQVIQPRRGNQPVPLDTGLRIIQVQITGQKILRIGVRRQRDALPQVARIRGCSRQGYHVHCGIIGRVIVSGTVHVDGDRRNDGVRHGVPVLIMSQIDRPRLQSVGCAHDSTSRNSQRAIQPCRTQHPAVLLRGQPDIILVRDAGVLLDLEGRRIAVRGGDHEAGKLLLRHPEGDER